MPELLHPGVYIQEVPPTTRAIEGASTSVAAFIGISDRGPIYKAVLVTSFSDFQAKFGWHNGGYRSDSYLAYAINSFFQNGGRRCYIIRATKLDDQAKSTGSVANLTLDDYNSTTIGTFTEVNWNQVNDGDNGTAPPNTASGALIAFLVDELGITALDKTPDTTISKPAPAADGTETITVTKGTTSIELKLSADKTKVQLTRPDGRLLDFDVAVSGGGPPIVRLPDIRLAFTVKAGIFWKDDKGFEQYGEEGKWGNELYIEITNGKTNPESEFGIIVKSADGTILETLEDLSIVRGTNNNFKDAINKTSSYICADTSTTREVESAGFMISGIFGSDMADISGDGRNYTTARSLEVKVDNSEFISVDINDIQNRQDFHLYLTSGEPPINKFDWYQVNDGDNGTAPPNTASGALIAFLVDELGITALDKTPDTTISKPAPAADGTETITVTKGSDSAILRLTADKTNVNVTGPGGARRGDYKTRLFVDLDFVADRIQEVVNNSAQDPAQPPSASNALRDFQCTYGVRSANRLYLKSGSYDDAQGTGDSYSSVVVRPSRSDPNSRTMVQQLRLSISTGALHGPRIFAPKNGKYRLGEGMIPPSADDYSLGSKGSDAQYQNLGATDFTDGLGALDARNDVSIIAVPGNGGGPTREAAEADSDQVISAGISYCRNIRPLGDCMFIADVPKSVDTTEEAVEFVSDLSTKNDYGALYFPWVEAPDPVGKGRNPTILLPPSGHIAGVYASIDSRRGVWKAPAGTEANVANAVGLKLDVKDIDQDQLNPKSTNAIRSFPGPGIVVWGARTLSSDIALRYVPVRRMTNFLKVSIYNGIQWAVFEPNDEPLWASLRLNIGAFMMDLFRQGAFQGTTPSEAFFVKCDKETNPQINIDRGIVTVLVGFAPLKPAEFVLVKISHKAGQATTS